MQAHFIFSLINNHTIITAVGRSRSHSGYFNRFASDVDVYLY